MAYQGENKLSRPSKTPPDIENMGLEYKEGDDPLRLINAYMSSVNIVPSLKEEELTKLSRKVVEGYNNDNNSRSKWFDQQKKAVELARLLFKRREWAGDQIANVMYPMITSASIQFASRAYATIIQGDNVVKGKVIGYDPDGSKASRAERVSKDMNYQLLQEMESWESDTDQLLNVLAIVGSEFKKTFFCSLENQVVSERVSCEDLVVNYHAKSLEKAYRITHVIQLTKNEIVERLNSGIFSNITDQDLLYSEGDASDTERYSERIDPDTQEYADESTPQLFYEQHTFADLDKDGYEEPYIITVHKQSEKVVRITARYDAEGVISDKKNKKIKRIKPVHYFTHYKFMQSQDGSFYGMGLGILLTSLNRVINSVINQLLDAGTLANRQTGFLGRGIQLGRTPGGESMRFRAGEWKLVNNTGADLRANVFPLPSKPPSAVLFQLLGLMIDSGKEVASMSNVMSGESPSAGTPAATTLALVEQGLKVFQSIYKRLFKSLKSEFEKIRRLNYMYRDPELYALILDANSQAATGTQQNQGQPQPQLIEQPKGATSQEAQLPQKQPPPTAKPVSPFKDYNPKDFDIVPVADSALATDVQRLMKAQALIQLQGQGLNDQEIQKRYLEALQIPEVTKLFPTEPPPPDPMMQMEALAKQAKAQLDQANTELIMEKAITERYNQAQIQSNIQFKQSDIEREQGKTDEKVRNTLEREKIERAKTLGKLTNQQEREKMERAKVLSNISKTQADIVKQQFEMDMTMKEFLRGYREPSKDKTS